MAIGGITPGTSARASADTQGRTYRGPFTIMTVLFFMFYPAAIMISYPFFLMAKSAQLWQIQEINDGTAYAHLASDVHENRQHAQDGVRMLERPRPSCDMFGVGEVG